MNTVVQMKPAAAGNLAEDSYTVQVRALINSEVRNYLTGGGKLNRLAVKTGLNYKTISKLAYYETARPRWHTVMAVGEALDILEKMGELMIAYARSKR